MNLKEFADTVQGFSALSQPEQILHLGWYIHAHREQERFSQGDIRSCFDELRMEVPNLSKLFDRLVSKRPRVLLKDLAGFYLERSKYLALDKLYGQHETTIAISKMLRDLPGKISNDAERLFLSEAIKCYHNRAFRAAIIMAWNLTYDHLLRWILAEPNRLKAFNSGIVARVGAKRGAGLIVNKREDFEELKESEVLDISGSAGIFRSDNTKRILDIQLDKRNLAAHPSLIIIDGPQADDTISSLVNNVVLILT